MSLASYECTEKQQMDSRVDFREPRRQVAEQKREEKKGRLEAERVRQVSAALREAAEIARREKEDLRLTAERCLVEKEELRQLAEEASEIGEELRKFITYAQQEAMTIIEKCAEKWENVHRK